MTKKVVKKGALLLIFLFSIALICGLFSTVPTASAEAQTLVPEYKWENTTNPFDPENPPTPEEVNSTNSPLGGYPIQLLSLTVTFPGQDVEVFFLYRDMFSYIKESDGKLVQYRSQQIDLFIWFYDENDIYYMANVMFAGISILAQETMGSDIFSSSVHYKVSDVFFTGDGNTICWNVTQSNYTFVADVGLFNLTVDYTFKVTGYDNNTLDLSLDTTIHIIEKPENISTAMFSYSYVYSILDWNANKEIPPEFSEDGKIAWYTKWDYDVAHLITADEYTAYYDNGSKIVKPMKELTVVATDWGEPPPWDVDGKYHTWVVYFQEEPINSQSGNLTKIFYDPQCLQFYAIRDRLVIPILIFGFMPLLMALVYRKSSLKRRIKKEEH